MRRLLIVIVCQALLAAGVADAGLAQGTGGQAGAFLKLGTHARPMALGQAYTALCRDASATYWNPAGLAGINRQELMVTYTAFPDSGEYSQAAYTLPLSEFAFPADEQAGSTGAVNAGTFGISIIRYAPSYAIEARTTDSLNPDYLFSDAEGAYGLAFGMPVLRNLYAGIGVKGYYHDLDQASATGAGVDMGVDWMPVADLTIAAAARDVVSQLNWSTGYQEKFPVVTRLGVAYEKIIYQDHRLLAAIDTSYRFTQAPPTIHAGVEYTFYRVLSLRAGYHQGSLTYGGGIRVPWIGWGRASLQIDYAAQEDSISGWDHWFTVNLGF